MVFLQLLEDPCGTIPQASFPKKSYDTNVTGKPNLKHNLTLFFFDYIFSVSLSTKKANDLLLCEDDPKFGSVCQVQLGQDSLAPGHMAGPTFGAGQCLSHQIIDPIDVQHPPCPLVQPCSCELVLSTGSIRADHFHLPQLVGHPNKQRMCKKTVWCRSLVVKVAWLWGMIPELQIVLKLQFPFRAKPQQGLKDPFMVLRWQALRPQTWELR